MGRLRIAAHSPQEVCAVQRNGSKSGPIKTSMVYGLNDSQQLKNHERRRRAFHSSTRLVAGSARLTTDTRRFPPGMGKTPSRALGPGFDWNRYDFEAGSATASPTADQHLQYQTKLQISEGTGYALAPDGIIQSGTLIGRPILLHFTKMTSSIQTSATALLSVCFSRGAGFPLLRLTCVSDRSFSLRLRARFNGPLPTPCRNVIRACYLQVRPRVYQIDW